jgi:Arc/MetJ-type ribon-helix-helix transcriptional regulator
MCYDPAMQVEISPETQDILDALVERGSFASTAEALDYAVQHLWEDQEWADPVWAGELQRLVDEGRESLARGPGAVIRNAEEASQLATEVISRARERSIGVSLRSDPARHLLGPITQ